MEKVLCPYCNTELQYKEGEKNVFGMMQYKCSKCLKDSVKPYGILTMFLVFIIFITNIWIYLVRMAQGEDREMYMYVIVTCIGIISYNYFFTKKVKVYIDNNKTE